MKLFKIFILALLFSSVTSTNAQDASNDATWAETIGFIKKYAYKIEEYKVEGPGINRNPTITFSTNHMKLKEDSAFNKYETKIDLTLLKELYVNSSSYKIELVFVKNFSFRYDEFCKTCNPKWRHEYTKRNQLAKTKSIALYFEEDSEFYPRIKKAFTHLAYLAKTKRDKQREDSGDKF